METNSRVYTFSKFIKKGKNGVVVVGEHGVNGDTYLIKMGEIIVYACVC